MFNKQIGYKDYKQKVRNETHDFQLEVRDVFKNMVQLYDINEWVQGLKKETDLRELPTSEVQEFYNNVEHVLLASYGIVSDDGRRFIRDGRYEFEDSKAFAVIMEEFLSDPEMANVFLAEIMPENMKGFLEKITKTEAAAAAALASDPRKSPEEIQAEIARLRGELAEQNEGQGDPATAPVEPTA